MTDKGLALGASDHEAVLEYLSLYFGVVNVNTAPLAELMRALRITQQQAYAIITYREMNGPFRDIDALKRVEGLDAAAIESNRSAITF
jgi:competence protein ComEA